VQEKQAEECKCVTSEPQTKLTDYNGALPLKPRNPNPSHIRFDDVSEFAVVSGPLVGLMAILINNSIITQIFSSISKKTRGILDTKIFLLLMFMKRHLAYFQNKSKHINTHSRINSI